MSVILVHLGYVMTARSIHKSGSYAEKWRKVRSDNYKLRANSNVRFLPSSGNAH
jgi:hypothetical protein